MSLKASLVRTAIKWTPKALMLWVGNRVLTGIARLGDIQIDLDHRQIYMRTTLVGEAEPIEVWLEDFAVSHDGQTHYAILRQARANKPWLTNLLGRITHRAFPIPDLPQLRPHMALMTELLKEQPGAPLRLR